MKILCNACGHGFEVPAGTLAADCVKCGAKITLTALETRPIAAGIAAAGGGAIAIRGTAEASPPPEALLGEELGGYRLKAILGGGGMGVVYEAERTANASFAGPEVAAVKVLSSVFANDPEFVERFRREADALIALRHFNLIEVYSKGEWRSPKNDGVPSYYFVMERFFGEDLRSLMARGAVAPATAASIVRGAAAGLAFAHAHGIVHRDVKPANILVSGDPAKDGRVKVVDFGVAQLATGQYTLTSLTRSHLILGTINYMSPEQRVDASEIDHRADVYALGVVAYELLTGRLPIGAFEPPSELAGLPRATDRAVMAALRRDPGQRPESATAFAELLERALVVKRKTTRWIAGGAASAAAMGAAAWIAVFGIGAGGERVIPAPKKGDLVRVAQKAEDAIGSLDRRGRPAQEPAPSEQAATKEAYVPPRELEQTADTMRVATELGVRAMRGTPQIRETQKRDRPKTTKKLNWPPVDEKTTNNTKDSNMGLSGSLGTRGTTANELDTKSAPSSSAKSTPEPAQQLQQEDEVPLSKSDFIQSPPTGKKKRAQKR